MSLLGKKWPVPVAGPMFPFFAAGLIVLYGVNAAASASMSTAQWKDDPRNPHAKPKGK